VDKIKQYPRCELLMWNQKWKATNAATTITIVQSALNALGASFPIPFEIFPVLPISVCLLDQI
jgi:hypothetical protein